MKASRVAFMLPILAGPSPPEEEGTAHPVIPSLATGAPSGHLLPPQRPFRWHLERTRRDPGIEVWRLTFPSPFRSPFPCNNTVHAEYYRPHGEKIPGVIVLDVLYDPTFRISRMVSESLARRGVAALLVKMAYQGERRPPGRIDPFQGTGIEVASDAVVQSVMDVRWAVSWFEERPEIDRSMIGITGTSMGGIVASICVAVDPRIRRAAFILAGGDLAEIIVTAPETRAVREILREKRITEGRLREALSPVEPLRFARPREPGAILMVNGLRDETVPPRCTQMLWKAFGQPEIRWYEAGHYDMIFHVIEILSRVARHFAPERFGRRSRWF